MKREMLFKILARTSSRSTRFKDRQIVFAGRNCLPHEFDETFRNFVFEIIKRYLTSRGLSIIVVWVVWGLLRINRKMVAGKNNGVY